MAVRETKIIICDRCGHEEDSAYSLSLAKHWLNIPNYGDLCPACAKEFRAFTTEFLGKKCPKRWDIEVHC